MGERSHRHSNELDSSGDKMIHHAIVEAENKTLQIRMATRNETELIGM